MVQMIQWSFTSINKNSSQCVHNSPIAHVQFTSSDLRAMSKGEK